MIVSGASVLTLTFAIPEVVGVWLPGGGGYQLWLQDAPVGKIVFHAVDDVQGQSIRIIKRI